MREVPTQDEVVGQLAMLSLLAVFKDICPGYRVRLPTEKELEVKVCTCRGAARRACERFN